MFIILCPYSVFVRPPKRYLSSFGRFRAGFQQVFCCCAATVNQEELELKSPRYLQTQVRGTQGYNLTLDTGLDKTVTETHSLMTGQ